MSLNCHEHSWSGHSCPAIYEAQQSICISFSLALQLAANDELLVWGARGATQLWEPGAHSQHDIGKQPRGTRQTWLPQITVNAMDITLDILSISDETALQTIGHHIALAATHQTNPWLCSGVPRAISALASNVNSPASLSYILHTSQQIPVCISCVSTHLWV